MNLSKEQKDVLKILLDKYEDSATFLGKNKVRQTFRLRPEEVFPRYFDETEYDYYVFFNEEMQKLQEAGFVALEERNGQIQKILLKPAALDAIYRALGRTSKNELLLELKGFLQEKEAEIMKCSRSDAEHNEVTEALLLYIHNQEMRFANGKYPEYYDRDSKAYKDIWKCLLYLTEIEEEIYVRDLSVLLFQDSKRLESIRAKIESLLHKYGEFAERETILAECGVI